MPNVPSKKRIILIAFAVTCMIFLGVAEFYFNALRSAPRIDRKTLSKKSNLVILLQPDKAPGFIHSLAVEFTGRPIPAWLLPLATPHEAGVFVSENIENDTVEILVYTSLKRFCNPVVTMSQSHALNSIVKQISWSPDHLESPERGLLVANGIIDSDVDALDQIYLQWGKEGVLVPRSLSGHHLWELLFDNRAGKAYLSMASMMTAFDFKLEQEHMDILLSSIQFVNTMRAHADVTEDDVLHISIDLDIVPTARNRIGVINMKGAVDEGFAELGKALSKRHGIQVEGNSEWNETTIEFRYTINKATPFVTEYLLKTMKK